MAEKQATSKPTRKGNAKPLGRPSPLVDTRVIYCGDCFEQLQRLPDGCVDLIYMDPPFNSDRNYEVFWGETKVKRAFEDRHASIQADALRSALEMRRASSVAGVAARRRARRHR